ncbi:MAG: hydroxypyruvate isomerase family protein [Pseudomonadota bacterium]
MPRFAANLSLLFPELPPLARIDAARRAGFAAVEIQFPYEVPAREWQRALADAGMPLVLFNVAAGDLMAGGDGLAGVPGREAAFAQALEQCADYVRVLKPGCVNVLAGRQPESVPLADCLGVLQRNLGRAVRVLSPSGVTVTVEAINRHDMPRFLLTDFASMEAAVTAVPGTAMQFDIYHMARAAEPLATHIAAHGARFGHVQFADVPGRGAPGSGQLDFPALFAALDASGYRGWCGAEYRPAAAAGTGVTQATFSWLARARGGLPSESRGGL